LNNDSYEGLTIEKLKAAVELLKKQSVPTGDRIIFSRPYMGKACSHCHKIHETHPWAEQIMHDHPHFNNNLEYLEWVEKNHVR